MTTPNKTDHKTLIEALTAVQSEMTDPACDSENPHFKSKYTSLTACLALARPILSRHGVLLIQRLEMDPQDRNKQTLITELRGYNECLESRMPIVPVKNDPQGIGSAISYARRYTLKPMLNMAEDDDDGNAASAAAGKQGKPQQTTPPQQQTQPAKPSQVKPERDIGDRREALAKFYDTHSDFVEAYLHGDTYGAVGRKQPWLVKGLTFNDLPKPTIDMICETDAKLSRFIEAVLAHNNMLPPKEKAA